MAFSINLDKEYTLRYDLGKFMAFIDDSFDPLTSTLIENIKSLKQEGITKIKVEAGRPDLISYRLYGDTQFWWIIMFYNDIFDVEDIKAGDFLGYPSQNDLDSYYFTLRQSELA